MPRIRVKKVESLIQEEVARFILHELADPRLGFITVTHVDCSRDLAYAKIFVSIMGTEAQQRTSLRALEDASGPLRATVGKVLAIRRVPEIRFVLDEGINRSIHMSELIREARAGDPDGGAEPTPPAPDPAADGLPPAADGLPPAADGLPPAAEIR